MLLLEYFTVLTNFRFVFHQDTDSTVLYILLMYLAFNTVQLLQCKTKLSLWAMALYSSPEKAAKACWRKYAYVSLRVITLITLIYYFVLCMLIHT